MQHTTSTAKDRFMRTHPGWVYLARNPKFIGITFLALVIYAVLLLPGESTPPVLGSFSIGIFSMLILAWSANILADGEKSELLKGIVAFGILIAFGWLFYEYSGAQWDRLQRSFFDWNRMAGNWGVLFEGLLVTLEIAFLSAIFSVVVGLTVAILRSFGNPTLNIFLVAYVDLFRSIPMVVIMVVLFFALPYVGISLGSITTTVVALSVGYGAYASECFRSGFESVHCGQIEAARSLGLSRWQTMRMIILPQAIPVVIPPLTGNLVSMLKDTAVASLVASPELLKRARELYTSKASPTPLVAAAMLYLAVLIPLVRISNMLENRVKKIK
jgi:His/Glu/Gln/Arg/opine family amino acid ABC transporter permease subunit